MPEHPPAWPTLVSGGRRNATNTYGSIGNGRTRRYRSFSEREDIPIELAKGACIRAIARKVGRPPSTVSRKSAVMLLPDAVGSIPTMHGAMAC